MIILKALKAIAVSPITAISIKKVNIDQEYFKYCLQPTLKLTPSRIDRHVLKYQIIKVKS